MSFLDRHLETLVGAFVIGSLLLVTSFIVAVGVGSGAFTRSHRYLLVLDDGVGLSGATVDVTIAGMEVGKVERVTLTDDRRVALELSVQSRYAHHVKIDSVGEVGMTLLGGKVVRLGPGSPEAPPLPDGGQLVAGNNFDVMHALEQMDLVHNLERLEAILVDINDLAKQMRLGDGRIPEAVDAMMLLIADMQDGKGTVGKLLKDEATLDEVSSAIESVERMAEKVEAAAVALERSAASVDDAGAAVVEGAQHIATASEALGGTAVSVDRSAEKLANSLDRLDRGLVELEKTMRAIQRIPFVKGAAKKEEREADGEAPPSP